MKHKKDNGYPWVRNSLGYIKLSESTKCVRSILHADQLIGSRPRGLLSSFKGTRRPTADPEQLGEDGAYHNIKFPFLLCYC